LGLRAVGGVLLFALVLAGTRPVGAADDWGLLLGLRQPGAAARAPGEAPAPDRYRTLWLTPAGTSVKTVVFQPLFVPRATGFWEVGSRRLTVKAWHEGWRPLREGAPGGVLEAAPPVVLAREVLVAPGGEATIVFTFGDLP